MTANRSLLGAIPRKDQLQSWRERAAYFATYGLVAFPSLWLAVTETVGTVVFIAAMLTGGVLHTVGWHWWFRSERRRATLDVNAESAGGRR